MKKIFKFNLILMMIGLISGLLIPAEASSSTGHKDYNKITFLYNPESKLLVNNTTGELNIMMSKVKKKAFGWSVYSNIANNIVMYEAGTIFSRSNNTSQTIDFKYNTTYTTKKQLSYGGSGTIGMKASGKIGAVSASLDSSIRAEIGVKNDVTFEEEMDFSIKILPNKRVSLLVKGLATLSNGASKYFFLGICTKKSYWECIDIMNEYYELYEEEI